MNHSLTRAQFLRGAAALTGAAIGAGMMKPGVSLAAATEPVRTLAQSSATLVLDGAPLGTLHAFGGGNAFAEVVKMGGGFSAHKTLGAVQYAPLELEFGLGLQPKLFEAIKAGWKGQGRPHSGSVDDGALERQFMNAQISETTFPAMDGAAKESGFLGIKLAPELTRDTKSSGKVPSAARTTAAKSWLTSNFQLKIEGVDASKVTRIESFSIKQGVPDQLGFGRDINVEPGQVEFPNLSVTFAVSSLPTWSAWFDDWVVRGNHPDSNLRQGTLTLFGASMQPLLIVNLIGVGICSLDVASSDGSADAIRKMTAELYCQRMELDLL